MIRGLIFDFDGLMLDTEIPAFQSWQEVWQQHGQEFTLDIWTSRIGSGGDVHAPLDDLEILLGTPLPEREHIARQRRERHLALVEAQDVLPGVQDYIREAKRLGLKLAVASSSPHRWVDGHLARLGLLDAFDAIRCSDDVTHRKPDPELFLSALQALGLQAEEAIVLEDSPNGVKAAKAAGIFCVAVPNQMTRQLSLEEADLRLDSLADLSLQDLLEIVEQRNGYDRSDGEPGRSSGQTGPH